MLARVLHCSAYLDDLVIYTDTWTEHIQVLRMVFDRFRAAKLTVNLAKCEFGKATVAYLGKEVGLGKVQPVHAKAIAIVEYPAPSNKRELRRFVRMTGYYPSFCRNFFLHYGPFNKSA